MSIIKPANLALRFALELCALLALGYWGFTTGQTPLIKILFGLGTPLIAAIIWGTFVSPKARVKLPDFGRLIFELLVFGSAILGLYAVQRFAPANTFLILVLIHLPLSFLLNQRGM